MKTVANRQISTKQNPNARIGISVKKRIEVKISDKPVKKSKRKKKQFPTYDVKKSPLSPMKSHEKRKNDTKTKINEQQFNINQISKELNRWASSDVINQLAEDTNFNKKSDAKILPVPFVHSMVHGLAGNGKCSYRMLAIGMKDHFNEDVSRQAIGTRFTKNCTVEFLEEILQEAMQNQLKVAAFNQYAELFPQFSGVKVEDSTQIELHESLSTELPGAGGSASSSSLKINAIYDITRKSLDHIDIVCGSCSDHSLGKKIRHRISEGELWIRDLGYFCLADMKAIIAAKAYYIARLKKGTKIFLNIDDKEPVEIGEFLRNNTKNKQRIDQLVYIGVSKIQMRLVVERVPKHIQKKRLERQIRENRKKGRGSEVDESYVTWLGYSVFITNVLCDAFNAKCIIAIYKIRWQIELYFKRSKSIAGLDIIKQTNLNCLKCILYIKLIALLVSEALISYLASIVDSGREISEYAVLDYLKSNNRLGTAIISDGLNNLIIDLICVMHLLSKERRIKTKSTFHHVKGVLGEMNGETENIAQDMLKAI